MSTLMHVDRSWPWLTPRPKGITPSKTQPFAFSGDEGVDVGVDGETNVSLDYAQDDNAFTGRIAKVTVAVK